MFDISSTTRARYCQGAGIQRILPSAVARPADLGALRAVIAEAARQGLSVTPRGAGTAMDGSNIGEGVVVDLSGFEVRRCVVDPVARLAHVTPSSTLATLGRAAATHGLRLPPDPSSGGWATTGGMLSTNASGARSLRFGSVRRWIENLDLETADGPLHLARGVPADSSHPVVMRWAANVEPMIAAHAAEIVARFPRVTKNSAGYALDRYLESGDLIDLVIGAEGTLGIVTGICWRLDAIPRCRASLRVALRERGRLVPAIGAIRGFDPSTIELLDRSFLQLASDRPGLPVAAGYCEAAGLLLADFEGEEAADVAARAHAAGAAVAGFATVTDVATSALAIDGLWAVRHAASPVLAALEDGRRSLQVIEDGCVPLERLDEYLDAVTGACAEHGVAAVIFGHAGDGHLHVNLLPDMRDDASVVRLRAIYQRVTDAVINLGGTPSGEHGTGRLRAPVLERLYGRTVIECFEAVRSAFDPRRQFNQGVLLGDADPFATLKAGPDAAVIPEEIDAWLRSIERDAQWGANRWYNTLATDGPSS